MSTYSTNAILIINCQGYYELPSCGLNNLIVWESPIEERILLLSNEIMNLPRAREK